MVDTTNIRCKSSIHLKQTYTYYIRTTCRPPKLKICLKVTNLKHICIHKPIFLHRYICLLLIMIKMLGMMTWLEIDSSCWLTDIMSILCNLNEEKIHALARQNLGLHQNYTFKQLRLFWIT